MSAANDSSHRSDTGSELAFPAYGPIDAALGYGLFYLVVDRATPTIVAVFTEVLPDVSPSLIGLGLAMLLWVVLLVTVLDQLRRQLAALGIVTHAAVRPRRSGRSRPSVGRLLLSLAVATVGGLIAAWTYDPALEAVVSLIRVVEVADIDVLVPTEVGLLLVFFVSFEIAARSVDKLVIGGLRALLGG
ncbi:hypothetical protein [Natrinema marinum]|uniref:hypothetical protein n=1 Tax=Natrinema marinum TaxID=2961598 RepID=UPI0020C8AA76|nr:hypothetical protein [Natrinema marinum]